MRALVLPGFGSVAELRDIDMPEPGASEVRVRVHAASVNGFDLSVAGGHLEGMMEHRFPVVLGKDFAGTVDAVGPEAEGFAVGDRVFGVVTKPFLGDGSFAEYVTVPVSVGVARLPEPIAFTDGAALGLAGTAASDAVDGAALEPGQTVLVVGATGGVGTFAVQLATQVGARVIATAHTAQERDLVTSLGASETVDYAGDVVAQVRGAHPEGVDAVIHPAGDPAAVLGALRDGGRFASTMLGSPEQLAGGNGTVVSVYANPASTTLDRLADAVARNRIRIAVEGVYPLAEAPQALAHFAGGTRGKTVLTVG